MKSFLLMIVYYTRIPIRYRYDYNEKDLSRGVILFPLIGLIIGFLTFIPALLHIVLSTAQNGFCGTEVFDLLFNYRSEAQGDSLVISRYVTAVLSWLVYIWVTGGLHLDGLADTFDGFFSNRDKEKIFEIMKDSRIGTFGVLGIVMISFINVILLAHSPFIYTIIFPVVGRIILIMTCSKSKYAKQVKGMGTTFVEACTGTKAIASFLLLLVLMLIIAYWSSSFAGVIAASILVCISFGILKWIKGIIGGMTGDTCGFMIEISQSIFLVTLYYIKFINI